MPSLQIQTTSTILNIINRKKIITGFSSYSNYLINIPLEVQIDKPLIVVK